MIRKKKRLAKTLKWAAVWEATHKINRVIMFLSFLSLYSNQSMSIFCVCVLTLGTMLGLGLGEEKLRDRKNKNKNIKKYSLGLVRFS